jgi:hypothetical protein
MAQKVPVPTADDRTRDKHMLPSACQAPNFGLLCMWFLSRECGCVLGSFCTCVASSATTSLYRTAKDVLLVREQKYMCWCVPSLLEVLVARHADAFWAVTSFCLWLLW